MDEERVEDSEVEVSESKKLRVTYNRFSEDESDSDDDKEESATEEDDDEENENRFVFLFSCNIFFLCTYNNPKITHTVCF